MRSSEFILQGVQSCELADVSNDGMSLKMLLQQTLGNVGCGLARLPRYSTILIEQAPGPRMVTLRLTDMEVETTL